MSLFTVGIKDLNVGLSVDVLEYLLKAPETALHHAENGLGDPPSLALQLLLDVGQNGPCQLDKGNDESTKGQGARMEPVAMDDSRQLAQLVVLFGLHSS